MRGRDRIAVGLVAATVGFAGLALGGAVRWAAVGASLGAIGAAIPYVTSRRVASTRSPLLVLLGLAIGLTLLQLLPLPVALAKILAPGKLELVTDNAAAFAQSPPTFVSASYDPPATLIELAKLVGYAALAWTAIRIAARSEGRRLLASVVVGTAVLVGLVTLAHELIGADEIYGIWAPPAKHPLLSPLLNDNHFASLMTIAVPVALALAMTTKGAWRGVWLGSAVLCASLDLFSGSRGGAVGLVIGVVITAAIMLAQRKVPENKSGYRRKTPIPAIIIGACVVTLIVALTAGRVSSELSNTEVNELVESKGWKVQTWIHSLPMIEDNAWLGVGRGAFEQAYTRYSPVGSVAYPNEENSYLQVIADWGVPGGLALLVCAGMIALAAWKRWRESPLEAGVVGALVALGAHDIVDFSLEMPVIAMATIALAAVLVPARVEAAQPGTSKKLRMVRGSLLIPAIATCVVTLTPIGRTARADAAVATDVDALAVACSRHPADYLLFGRAAQGFMEARDQRALTVLARALFLNPKHVGLHRLAAAILVSAGQPQQAQAELALAIGLARGGERSQLIDAAVATFQDPDDAARALPMDAEGGMELSRGLAGKKYDDVNLAFTKRLAFMYPGDATSRMLYAKAALTAKQPAVAIVDAREAFRLEPSAMTAMTLARALQATGDAHGAVETLKTALATTPPSAAEHFEMMNTLIELEIADGDLASANAALEQLASLVSDQRGRIQIHYRRAQLHDRRGETNQAKYQRDLAHKLERGETP